VDKQQTPKERLETIIYDIYTSIFYETASDRRQVYCGQIWEKIVLWCNKYNDLKYNDFKIDANEMGVEIYNVIKRLVKNNNETVKNKFEFFNILKKSMKNAKNEYIRNYEQGLIKISKEKEQKLKRVNDFISMKESQHGRKLTNDEEEQCILKWFKKQEFIDLYNASNVRSISYNNIDENDDIVVADPNSIDPLDEYINKTDIKAFLEAVKSVLEKKQERAIGCYRELFTLHCIENYKNFERLYPVFDNQVLKDCQKDGKKPNQYEIYQKYHPKAQKSSAEVMASTNLREFLNEIKTYLKEKNI